jgi:phosphatidylglycerophosphatase A
MLGLAIWALLPPSAAVQAVAIVAVMAAGVWSATLAERHFRATDPSRVVVDEVLGMLVTLFLNPVGWAGAGVGFFLFRVFDVIKPYPANRLERLHGGFGIMSDDFMAAVYANIVLRVALSVV